MQGFKLSNTCYPNCHIQYTGEKIYIDLFTKEIKRGLIPNNQLTYVGLKVDQNNIFSLKINSNPETLVNEDKCKHILLFKVRQYQDIAVSVEENKTELIDYKPILKHIYHFLDGDISEYSFLFVEELSRLLDYAVYVIGGSAAYLHILNRKNVKIQLNDIDFQFFGRYSAIDFNTAYDRLKIFTEYFCKKYSLDYTIDDSHKSSFGIEEPNEVAYIQLFKDGVKLTPLNYFINQLSHEEIDLNHDISSINGINVEKYENVVYHSLIALFRN